MCECNGGIDLANAQIGGAGSDGTFLLHVADDAMTTTQVLRLNTGDKRPSVGSSWQSTEVTTASSHGFGRWH